MQSEEANWFVVYTRPRWEKKVAKTLLQKGIEHYCPLNKVQKQWSDRKKVVYEPLFKGYVFVRIAEHKKWDIKKIDGILNYVYWLGKPAIVKEAEIDVIRKFLREFNDVQVVDSQINKNVPITVKQGIMMNYKGIVLEVNGNKAKVKINSMGVEITAVFDRDNLQVLHSFKISN